MDPIFQQTNQYFEDLAAAAPPIDLSKQHRGCSKKTAVCVGAIVGACVLLAVGAGTIMYITEYNDKKKRQRVAAAMMVHKHSTDTDDDKMQQEPDYVY